MPRCSKLYTGLIHTKFRKLSNHVRVKIAEVTSGKGEPLVKIRQATNRSLTPATPADPLDKNTSKMMLV